MEKVFIISEDDGYGDEDEYYSDIKIVKVFLGSDKFKIQDLKIEFESKTKATWKALEKKERRRSQMNDYMRQNVNIQSFSEWLKNEKGFKEAEIFEEIRF